MLRITTAPNKAHSPAELKLEMIAITHPSMLLPVSGLPGLEPLVQVLITLATRRGR
jgi:hypothetical protein